MDKSLVDELRTVLADKSTVPKVKAGRNAGLITAIVGAVVTGVATGDWRTGLVTAAAMALPVVFQFGMAWIKADPRMELMRRVLAEMEKSSE